MNTETEIFMGEVRIAQVEIVVYKIIEGELLYLLLKRVPKRGDFWQPITGGAREDEKLEDAAKRELFEETQIRECNKFISGVHYFEFDSECWGRVKEYVFGAEVDENVNVELSDEHSEYMWCTLSKALEALKYDSNKDAFRKMDEMLNIGVGEKE